MPEKSNGYKFVVNYIRLNPGKTQDEITRSAPRMKDEIIAALRDLDARGLLTYDERGGIRFHQILGPKPTRQAGFWVAEAPPVTAIPDRFQYPHVKEIAPRDQGDRGTCVGQGCVHSKDALYYVLTGNLPSPEDKAQYKKDVVETNKVIHDILYPQSGSAEGVYQRSRQIGNVTYPEGSYTYCGLKAMSKNGSTKYNCGVAFEDEWNTSKTPKAVYYPNPPPATIDAAYADMATHQIDGYAQVSASFDGAKAAIYAAGGICVGSIAVYENYSQMRGGDGTFPDPKGSVSGYHCMYFYGYDATYLYVLHSWGDFCGRYGKISRTYVEKGGLTELFKPLDSEEAARYADTYVHLDFKANIPCNISVDGKYLGTYRDETNYPSGQFKKGVEITVDAEALDYYDLHVTQKYTPQSQAIVYSTFTVPPTPVLADIKFKANTPCNFYVDEKYIGTYYSDEIALPSAQLEVGVEVTVDAEALNYYNLHDVKKYTPSENAVYHAALVIPPEPDDPWYIKLIKWILSLFGGKSR